MNIYIHKEKNFIVYSEGLLNDEFRIATIEEVENDKLQKIKNEKIIQLADNRENYCERTAVTYENNKYRATQNARLAILNNISTMTNSSPAKTYFTEEKQAVLLNKSGFVSLRNLIEEREIEARTIESQKIKQINDATTLEEVEQINVEF